MASSYEMLVMGLACFTNFGFAVNIPLTSVYISSNDASSAAATMAAVKSEPPLPSVVATPSELEAINPPMTTMAFLLAPLNSSNFWLVRA